ncbi:unnamed protein product, partial [marine sediment metagenome]
MAFQKGHTKSGGRALGTRNKVNEKSGLLLSKIINRDLQHIWDKKGVNCKDQTERVSKLANYVLPK